MCLRVVCDQNYTKTILFSYGAQLTESLFLLLLISQTQTKNSHEHRQYPAQLQ